MQFHKISDFQNANKKQTNKVGSNTTTPKHNDKNIQPTTTTDRP